jgi:type IV secretory pathway VirJ component
MTPRSLSWPGIALAALALLPCLVQGGQGPPPPLPELQGMPSALPPPPPAAPAAAAAPEVPKKAHHTTRSAAPKSSLASSSSSSSTGERTLSAGRFGTVTVYMPDGTPKSVAIFLSGDGGWQLGVLSMAHALVTQGAVVIGVDIRQYLGAVGAAAQRSDHCQIIAADFEDLSHRIQKEIGLTEYHVPVLIGYSSGATVVYAVLVQSPPGTFAGALSMGFCPDQDFSGAALCPGPGPGLRYTQGKKNELIFEPAKDLKQPWVAFQGQKDQVCSPTDVDTFAGAIPSARVERLPLVGHGFSVEANWMPQFKSAYLELVPHAPPPPPPEIGDLPLNVVQAEGSSPELALLVTGDGGWAGLDQELAARLAASGVPTVSLNSLKYFWSERKPQEVADDVGRIMRHYLAEWHKDRVLLVGYSFGADVLPFVVRRLPPDLRGKVATLNLMGLDSTASFEVSIGDWLGTQTQGPPTAPELAGLGTLPVLCIYGEGEKDSLCPTLATPGARHEEVGKGHHFSGEYAQLADRILAFARSPRPRS